MAEAKINKLEREYTIPLRRFWLNVPQYERSSKAIKAIKIFLAKHMKVPDRDVNKVKLDVYFNNEIWFRGRANPPGKIKVKAVKEGDIVKVSFVQEPAHVKFLKAKHEKRHKPSEKPAEEKKEAPAEKEEAKTEEQKTEEKEKEKSVAEAAIKEAKQEAKAEKHITKAEKAQRPQRMALQK
jgi:large subunit ribosomal protein L31e